MTDQERKTIQEVHDLLMNLQPHIPQACYPGHAGFIDNYIDPALEKLAELLSVNNIQKTVLPKWPKTNNKGFSVRDGAVIHDLVHRGGN